MMRRAAPVLFLLLLGCGGPPGTERESTADGQSTQPRPAAATSMMDVTAAAGVSFDTPATVAPEIEDAWSGVRIRLVDRETGAAETYDIPLDGADILGESGLVVSAGVFLPDFILDENGITSRSAEPINPAVRVVISADGMEDFEGWLFASMPEIHPYPHPRYQVLLVEGIPSGATPRQ